MDTSKNMKPETLYFFFLFMPFHSYAATINKIKINNVKKNEPFIINYKVIGIKIIGETMNKIPTIFDIPVYRIINSA